MGIAPPEATTSAILPYMVVGQDELRVVLFQRDAGRLVQSLLVTNPDTDITAGPATLRLAYLYEDTGLIP